MIMTSKCLTPFVIQCFVTAGVSLNMAGLGLVMGFVTGLLPQLRDPNSDIQIDDTSASWIASLPGFSIIFGNFLMPPIMGHFGRRIANLCSLVVAVIGWTCIVFSYTVNLLYIARFLQGIGMGMIAALAPVLIGEYTSPRNRGMFLMTISLAISMGVLAIQTLGAYLPWKMCGLVCIGVLLLDIVLVIFSPESPTFLADKERYDECRKTFIYLRGEAETEELEKMITTRMLTKKEQVEETLTFKENISSKLKYFRQTLKKKEFNKPILIMFHVYTMAQWSGVNIVTSFTADLFEKVIGTDAGVNIPFMIVIAGIHRFVANIVGLVIIKTIKRRVLLFSTISLNIVILLAIAAYTYAKVNNWLPFDHPAIGILLIHIHIFSIATGAIPLGYVLAGELFPVEYKSLCGGISTLFFSLNLFASVKTVLYFLEFWDIYGTYTLYAGILVYCLVVIGVLLPETKDKTLQDIEEEFKGIKSSK